MKEKPVKSEEKIPDPKRGGTFLICNEDGCKFRTGKIGLYRRHWRNRHREMA